MKLRTVRGIVGSLLALVAATALFGCGSSSSTAAAVTPPPATVAKAVKPSPPPTRWPPAGRTV